MKSNSSAPFATVVAAGLSVAAIASVRGPLASQSTAVRAQSDVYALPSPEQTLVMSLGWRAALADLIFADVLVSYGLHLQDRRKFEFAADYLDAVNALDPRFRDPYRYADTILTLQGAPATIDDYRRARAILARGLQNLPYDAELWRSAGQYLAYLSWPHVPEEDRAEWRTTGARWLARSCELLGSDPNLPYHCITAAALFSRLGEKEAMVEFLERVQVVSDNPEIRDMAASYLVSALDEREQERAKARAERFRAVWSRDFTFVTRDAILAMGPRFDATRCAGGDDTERSECATTWRDWHERRDRGR